MALPPDFQFSQSNLQDYVDCRYRFLLRYINHVAWPALEAEPAIDNELSMQRGAHFHGLVQQYLLGIPPENLTPPAREDALNRWWQAYLSFIPSRLKGIRYPEITLSAPLLSHRLLAKYDLLMILPEGRAIIYDWKTSSKKMRHQSLLGRMQTRVYPWLLVQASSFLNQGPPFQPDQVEMIYWFTEAPTEPERIVYNRGQFDKDSQFLAALVSEITNLKEDNFHKTTFVERCKYCTYRSLCERGVQAGMLEESDGMETEADASEDFNFDQIGEIAY